MNLRFIIRKNKKGWEDHFATHYANFALINAFKCGNKVTAICIFVFELICKSKESIGSTLYYELISIYWLASLRSRTIVSQNKNNPWFFQEYFNLSMCNPNKSFFCKMTDGLAVMWLVNMSWRMTLLFCIKSCQGLLWTVWIHIKKLIASKLELQK